MNAMPQTASMLNDETCEGLQNESSERAAFGFGLAPDGYSHDQSPRCARSFFIEHTMNGLVRRENLNGTIGHLPSSTGGDAVGRIPKLKRAIASGGDRRPTMRPGKLIAADLNWVTPWEWSMLYEIWDRGGLTKKQFKKMCEHRGIDASMSAKALRRWLEITLVTFAYRKKLVVNIDRAAEVKVMSTVRYQNYLGGV